jgi:cell division protein FtsN/nucleoid DNA-binding protein
MIIGKYIRMLLEERKRVILPGFGNLEVVIPEGTQALSGDRFNPPGSTVKFDAGFSKDDGLLADTFAAGEALDGEEAAQRVLELVDAIKFALDKGETYAIPETGTFSRDADGKVRFQADQDWVLEPDQYGLESMDLLELEELPAEDEQKTRSESASGTKVTTLAPPRPKPKAKRWRVIWAVAALLIVVLVVLLLVPTRESGQGERRKLFQKKADREQVEQDVPVTDSIPAGTEAKPAGTETGEAESEPETTPEAPPETPRNFYIIAGSFQKLKNASDMQDQLNRRGYQAEVMITENRMYRVSVASYATKEEAEKALQQIKSEPGLQSSWLLSN